MNHPQKVSTLNSGIRDETARDLPARCLNAALSPARPQSSVVFRRHRDRLAGQAREQRDSRAFCGARDPCPYISRQSAVAAIGARLPPGARFRPSRRRRKRRAVLNDHRQYRAAKVVESRSPAQQNIVTLAPAAIGIRRRCVRPAKPDLRKFVGRYCDGGAAVGKMSVQDKARAEHPRLWKMKPLDLINHICGLGGVRWRP
jgi:hypothetical protein